MTQNMQSIRRLAQTCGHGKNGVGHLGLPGQLGFRQRRHANNMTAPYRTRECGGGGGGGGGRKKKKKKKRERERGRGGKKK